VIRGSLSPRSSIPAISRRGKDRRSPDTVEEVSEGGSVPDLLVTNLGGSRVLFLEGEELRGAKRNRVLNTSVLVAAHSKTRIPVRCVEQGRWRYRSRHFVSDELGYLLGKVAEDLIQDIHGIAEVAGLDGDELCYPLGKVAETRRIE
jgi:ARG and Rhodanese-Phosphatase-superfamily-associated Protein domain